MKIDPIPGPFRSYIPKTHENQAVETVRRVREAVGDDIDLLIEVHRRLSPMHAISLARRRCSNSIFYNKCFCYCRVYKNIYLQNGW